MTTIYKTHTRLHVIVLICLILQGCDFNSSLSLNRTWINDRIDEKKRDEIKKINQRLVEGFKNNDASLVKAVMSDTLLQVSGSRIDSITNQVSPSFHSGRYSILNEYNILNTSANVTNTIKETDARGNQYTINYLALNKEMYVSLLLIKDNTGDILLTTIYGNYDGKWKMNIFRVGRYRYYGKSAMDLYQIAKKDFARSYLVDAVCDLSMANECISPASGIFQYKKEAEYKSFFDTVLNNVKSKYHFPLTLDRIASKPKLLNIYPQMADEGYFPLVIYLSDINLKDTVSLKTEYENVKIEIKRLFTGISTGKKYTYYQAYNQIPDGIHSVPYYGFTDAQ